MPSKETVYRTEFLRIDLESDRDKADVLYINLHGVIDSNNSDEFRKRMIGLIDRPGLKFVFDLGELSFVSSSGISSFNSIMVNLKKNNGDMVLTHFQPRVAEVFSLLGLKRIFNIADNREDGIKALYPDTSKKNPPPNPLLTGVFPRVVSCVSCQKKFKVTKTGKYRCPNCKGIIEVK